MADIKAKEEVVPRSPNWQNYLGMLTGEAQPQGSREFFPAGSNTLGRDQMETGERIADKDRASRESMHSSDLANRYKMHSESLALQKWIAEQRNELDWAEYNAAMEALRGVGDDPYDVEGARNTLGASAEDNRWVSETLAYAGNNAHFGRLPQGGSATPRKHPTSAVAGATVDSVNTTPTHNRASPPTTKETDPRTGRSRGLL